MSRDFEAGIRPATKVLQAIAVFANGSSREQRGELANAGPPRCTRTKAMAISASGRKTVKCMNAAPLYLYIILGR
jgi:hypothetical protein